MKHLRIFILVLLAVLLPVRGAVAATMLCPEGETPSAAAEHGHLDMRDMATAHHHGSEPGQDGDSSSSRHPTHGHFCASTCCMAAMVDTVPFLGQPGLATSVAFPAVTSRIPPFQSGGQDRPPRTL